MRKMLKTELVLIAIIVGGLIATFYTARKYGGTGVTQDGQPVVLSPRQTCDMTPEEMLDSHATEEDAFVATWMELEENGALFTREEVARLHFLASTLKSRLEAR